MIHLAFLALTALTALTYPAPAQAADKVLNGGDACERRFIEVRDDLTAWIQKGGARALSFAKGQGSEAYGAAMLGAMARARVSCTADTLRVGASEKVCVNESDSSGNARIVCQRDAYLALSVNEQYRLTHHEYAGLAGFETNEGETSNYELSDQLTGYLDSYLTQRLTVKSDQNAGDAIDSNFKDFLGNYEIIGCSTATDFPKGTRDLNLCDIAVIKIERQDMLFGQPGSSLLATPVWLKKPDVKGGIVLGYSNCQLGYGTIDCNPGNNGGMAPPPGQKVFYRTRIVKAGGTTFLDISIEDTREETRFEKWSLVLKPYTGPEPKKN